MAELITNIETKKAAAELGYRAKIEIGGSDPSKFVPNINCSFERKLSDEFYFNVNASDIIVNSEKESLASVSEISVGDRTERFYVDSHDDLEYEIELAKKPASNIITLDVKCSSELEFCYQSELTQAEIEAGHDRPDDIINSYAIYCGSEHNEYQTGKLAHIKRSWVETSEGKRDWCEQSIIIEKGIGIWEIVIPEKIWNDESLYPLIVGPTLGYDTVGSSTLSLSDTIRGVEGTTDGSGGTAESVSVALSGWGSGENIKCAIYRSSDYALMGSTEEKSSGGSDSQFHTFAFSSGPTLASSTAYLPVGWADSTCNLHFDSASCNRAYQPRSYDSWPDPLSPTYGSSTYKYSTYCTYGSAGTTRPLPQRVLSGCFSGPLGGPI